MSTFNVHLTYDFGITITQHNTVSGDKWGPFFLKLHVHRFSSPIVVYFLGSKHA